MPPLRSFLVPCRLSGVCFSGVCFSGVCLRGVCLRGAHLRAVSSCVVVLLVLALLAPLGAAQAQRVEDTHTVTAEVALVSAVSVTALPPLVTGPESGGAVTGTYSVVTNRPAAQSIVVSVEGTPPEGLALYVDLESPTGAQKAREASLQVLTPDGTATPRTVVTGIGQVSATDLTVSVRTEVRVAAAPGDAAVRLSFELVE